MADFSWKPIQQIQAGDLVIGYKFSNHRWRSVAAKVTNTFHRKANIVRMVTNKTTVYCTHDHKWLTTFRGRLSCAYKKTEAIKKETIRFISNPVLPPIIDSDYKEGWLNGVLRGDGCIRAYPNNPNNKTYFRLAVKDHEILERFQTYTNHDLNEYDFLTPRIRAIQSQKKSIYQYMLNLTKNYKPTLNFAKGFLAGVFDAEGSYSDCILRISNTDLTIIRDIQRSCKKLGFPTVLEPQLKGTHNNVRTIRITGGLLAHIRFFALTNPSVRRKRKYLLGRTTRSPHFETRAKILSTTDCGLADVYNITTETGNYVANGLVSKNCYGRDIRNYKHYWNGDVKGWEQAFERLGRDIYFVFSYGECMGSHGFYECVDMIGNHRNWTLNILTNLSYDPTRLLKTHLANDGRLFVTACWHPTGWPDRLQGWKVFQKHLLMLKEAEIPTHVMMVWYKPQIKWFPEYFDWLDAHDFRVTVRRFVYDSFWSRKPIVRSRLKRVAGKIRLEDYTEAEHGYLYAASCGKVQKYSFDLVSPRGKPCNAGKDMILVKHEGTVGLCACCHGSGHTLGNIFDSDFKLNTKPVKCPTNSCGGHFGTLVLPDSEFDDLPEHLWRDTFVSQAEHLRQTSPVAYPCRAEMLKWIEALKAERKRVEPV